MLINFQLIYFFKKNITINFIDFFLFRIYQLFFFVTTTFRLSGDELPIFIFDQCILPVIHPLTLFFIIFLVATRIEIRLTSTYIIYYHLKRLLKL